MAVEAAPDPYLRCPVLALLDHHGGAGHELAHDTSRDRRKLAAIGVKRDEAKPERKPGDRIAQHGAGAAAITREYAAAHEDRDSKAEGKIAEDLAVEAGDGTGIAMRDEQYRGKREDEEGNPGRQVFSLSRSEGASAAREAAP